MFQERSSQKEIMDDLEGAEETTQTLIELDIINRKLGGNKVTLSALNNIIKKNFKNQEVRIADLGCGGGDILKAIAIWGRKNNFRLKLTGIDANPNIIQFAKENTKEYSEINYDVVNIFSEDFKQQKFDLITCSLFTHHFANEELIALIGQLKPQCQFFIINDLHRHPLAYYSIKILTRLFSKSEMVKNDAPISVLRSFTKNDFNNIFKRANVHNYSIKWMWAFRWQVILRF
jgi:2-polyprenyl-3-methyl-5-hydroxy-6-metoxy-1,4-benzoquinol methylase